ncbi:DUF4468 domain-containing protein [Sphingobacterium sp. DK4209]|uniref:DUF4468 domain-containing protein n=1 Tax=Sphingobacterium zhuxiongii TaxID=2662364 RepID=A0A5Q0QCI8_9SPHI|nr:MULTISPECIES: DUF4468 domain-containing protein [unclassified Sphingobacterium]MVZ67397.1 DUF4468 domain-containing protein [Sphingobacterium sp. DK4209]QGA25408.1 DUF4468 domain-containing protein [Sphingobacterium sp. dk4302]
MKNILIALILLMPLLTIGQDLPIVNDKIVYERIIESPNLSKPELYAACKRFIANTFKSAKSVIQTEDENTGLIICKGNTILDYPKTRNSLIVTGMPVGGRKSFTMQFENKEGRCRVKIYDIFEDNSLSAYQRNYSLEEIMFDLAKRANSSKGKTKEKRTAVFDESVSIVNNSFLGLIKEFEESIATYKSNDNW